MSVEVFISYSHRDEELCNQLRSHLAILRRLGQITDWHDRRIGAGTEWAGAIDQHLRSAQVILLLISADFLASDYCYDIETRLALERHAMGEAVVIPVILRPVDWTGAPFADLQAVPPDGVPITLWPNRDEAFALVTRAIRQAVTGLRDPLAGAEPLFAPAEMEGERILDAAIARQIYVGRATELLVQVRRTESGGLRALVTEEPDIGIAPEQVRSKPFDLTWPVGRDGKLDNVRLLVKVDAPSFTPERQTKTIVVPPDDDSEVCGFLMTPTQTGPLLVQVELEWNEATGPQRTLRTQCSAEGVEPSRPLMNVVSVPAFSVAGTGWSAAAGTFTWAVPAQSSAQSPAPAAPGAPSAGGAIAGEMPKASRPSSRLTYWNKSMVVTAALVIVLSIGTLTTFVSRQQPPVAGDHSTAPQQKVWLTLNRGAAPNTFELRTEWNPAWGPRDLEHGYRISAIPAEAGLSQTVRCDPAGPQTFLLTPSRPELLAAVEVCPLVLNQSTQKWDRSAAPCRFVAIRRN